MSRIVILAIIWGTAAFGEISILQKRLAEARTGDYLVIESPKTTTLIAIRSNEADAFVIEEISAPSSQLTPYPTSWPDWVKHRAPGHSSWSMIELNIRSGEIIESYSFSKNGWIVLSQEESLFATLLQLPMQLAPTEARKKIGPPPMGGEADTRQIWQPSLVISGKRIGQPRFDVFTATWPQDGTELSGHTVWLYFDQEERCPFPIWVQFDTTHATITLRGIDSGRGLVSPYRFIPKRIPEFIGTAERVDAGVRLRLKTPPYFTSFHLYAIDITAKDRKLIAVAHQQKKIDKDLIALEIDDNELKLSLQPKHRYHWLVVPEGHSEAYSESSRPFLF
ncbi:MAG: hypothetical protein RL235_996 [Chlamydiota bacterium]|jgi:hypothetical protein